jgi:hypothetical protein
MKPFSTIVYETLMTAGIERGRTAIREAHGMDAGLPTEEKTDPLTDAAAGGPRIRSGMGKTGAARAPASFTGGGQARLGQGRSPILQVHTNPNAGHMPTRQRRSDVRLSLVRT